MKFFATTFITILMSLTAFAGNCDIAPKFSYKVEGLSVAFDNRTEGDVANISWDFGDGEFSTEVNPQHVYETAGEYTFELTVSSWSGCEERFEGMVKVFETSVPSLENETEEAKTEVIETVEATNSISAYPNPMAYTTNISFELATDENIEVALYSISGAKVMTLATGYHTAGAHDVRMDRNNLPAGMYVIALTANGTVTTNKLTIQ